MVCRLFFWIYNETTHDVEVLTPRQAMHFRPTRANNNKVIDYIFSLRTKHVKSTWWAWNTWPELDG